MSTKTNNILKRQYGLFTAICLVVGSVIGTGIFWLPGRVLHQAGGDLWTGVLAWVVGGTMVATCVYMFSVMARRYEMIHGMVDYAESLVSKKYGYLVAWFFCVMYQTAGYAIIAWITANFTATLAGLNAREHFPIIFGIMLFYMVTIFLLNYFIPKLPMKFHVSSTVARIIPLILVAIIGVIAGLLLGDNQNLSQVIVPELANQPEPSFLGAVFATAFAYNGWQAATAFNSEINDSKKKFPFALMIGFGLVMVIYIGYYIGIVASGEPYDLMLNNQLATRAVYNYLFGDLIGNVMMVFVIISGLGILNLCCMGMSRSLYALGRRGNGPVPHVTVKLDERTGLPLKRMIICVALAFVWAIIVFGNHNWWTNFEFNLPNFYNTLFFSLLIPIFIGFFIHNRKNKDIHPFNRLIMPFIATFGAAFMNYSLISSSFIHAVVYYSVGIIIAAIGFIFFRNKTTA